MATPQKDMAETLRAQLELGFAEAEEEERQWLAKLTAVQARLTAARERKKQLTKMMDILCGRSGGGVTKDQVRPIVTALLNASGPASDEAIGKEVQRALKEKEMPQKGLPLVLKALKAEFAGSDGTWALPASNSPGREVGGE